MSMSAAFRALRAIICSVGFAVVVQVLDAGIRQALKLPPCLTLKVGISIVGGAIVPIPVTGTAFGAVPIVPRRIRKPLMSSFSPRRTEM